MTTIKVNERTKAGKALIQAAKIMAENHTGIEFIEENEVDDRILLKKMLAAKKSGEVSRSKVVETLTSILEK